MTNVKICGLSRPEDIEAVNRYRPDFIGFVFAPSRRQVNKETARSLRTSLDASIQVAGVFVNQPPEEIVELLQEGIIDSVQLHGDEDDAAIAHLKSLYDCMVIKSVGIGNALPKLPAAADYLLFDTMSSERGGTGRVFDWNVLEGYAGTPYFLAGGLDAENVGEAVARLHPFCVDVSSGIENGGVKDREKIERFIKQARGQE